MKNPSNIKISIAVAAMVGCSGVGADHHSDAAFAPVEIYACNFLDGKDKGDLDRATGKWNAWMDKSGGVSYSAYQLTPLFYSSDIKFDIAWLGVWPDGATMGAGLKNWLENSGSLPGEFRKILKCDAHSNFAAMTIQPEKDPSNSGPVQFRDCTMHDGRSSWEGIDAIKKWNDFRVKGGSEAGRWVLFPAYGESSKADYDFKFVTAFPSYEAFGENYDFFAEGGYKMHRKIISSKMKCDVPRVYSTKPVRVTTE